MKSALILLLSSAVSLLHAQDYTFKVLISKGQNDVRSGTAWHAVRVGESLREDDQLKVSENGYVGLIHASGRPYEVKEGGSYLVATLASRVGQGASVLNKYTDFILSSEQEKRNKLAATGAVHRGDRSPIDLYLPGPGIDHFYEPRITICWEPDPDMAPYTVVFTNLYGDELMAVESQQPALRVNLDSGALASQETVLVTVQSKSHKNKSSSTRSLKRMSPELRGQVTGMLGEFDSALDSQTPLGTFVLAGFYEERGLIVDALSCYSQAGMLAPEVPDYQAAYTAFLERLNFKKPSGK